MNKPNEKIFVKVLRNGFIPYINMCGPILNPIKLTRETCHKMIIAGINVHKFDPETKESYQLTLQNVFEEDATSKKEETPVVDSTPVTPDPVPPVELSGVEKADVKVDMEESADEVTEESESKVDADTMAEEAFVKDANTQINNNNKKNKKKNK